MIISTRHLKQWFIIAICVSALAGCAAPGKRDARIDQKIAELEKQEEALKAQQMELEKKEQALEKKAVMAAQQTTAGTTTTTQAPGGIDAPLLPPNARPGECYARVFVPPTYETATEKVLKTAESEKIEIIPATYKTVEKEVLVSEESSRRIEIPAKYDTETKSIEVSPQKLVWRINLSKDSAEARKALLDTAQKHGIDLGAANPGDCFHEHYLPPVYETVTSEELVVEESTRVDVIPAQYEMVNEKVVVSEATTELVDVPATYKWEEEKILVKEARTEWKKGRGLIERVDNTTGEIMCLVEVPAEYKTVRKKVVDQPARTITKEIPAVYKTVQVKKMVSPATEKKTVIPAEYKSVSSQKMVQDGQFVWHEIHNMDHPKRTRTGQKICLVETPAQYRSVTKTVVVKPAETKVEKIPAVYKTVKVKVVDKPAQEKKVVIPAEYQEITKEKKVTEGRLEWRNVLCETNTTPDMVMKLQSALREAGYNPGPTDGAYGSETARAVKKYQKDKGFATGGLTFETLKALGVHQ